MTHTAAFDDRDVDAQVSAETGGAWREAVVQLSMLIVVVAVGFALRMSFGFSVFGAIGLAVTIYSVSLLAHTVVRRSQDVAELNEELDHLEDENEELRRMAGPPWPPAPIRDPHRLPIEPSLRATPTKAQSPAAPTLAKPGPATKSPAPPTLSGPPAQSAAPSKAPSAQTAAGQPPAAAPQTGQPPRQVVVARGTPKATVPAKETAPAAKPSATPASAKGASTAARPAPPPLPRPPAEGLAVLVADKAARSRPAQPDVPRPAVPAAARADAPAEAPRAPAVEEDPRAQDVAVMQSLIKGLAEQINGPAKAAEPKLPMPLPHEMKPELDAPSFGTVDDQVDALRDAAIALRAPAGRDELVVPELRVPEADSDYVGADLSLNAQIAGALDHSRIDIYLEPILGLDDRKARHFEVSVRLRDEDGELLDPHDFAGAIAGTGLVPRIESYSFTETIRLAGQFAARGSDADLFSNISGESLRDSGFHAALVDALEPDVGLATHLIMSISQSEIRTFGPAHWDALAAMASSGLRYALIDVVDLDMDFDALKRYGFDFVRLDAPVFLRGLPAPHGFVPAADLCRHLAQSGFTLIVSRIADERELVKVFGFGALLGQGRLFGGARPIKIDQAPAQSAA
jgi:cyclic-di-GMP phosphodiesterase TipF (flagellum assembly factor)